MKNIMRRTVAFMLMACLLLSVMAPTAFAETTDTVTYSSIKYDFGTADKSTIAYADFRSGLSVTENDNATLYSWSTNVISSRQGTCKITNDMFGFRGQGYHVALRLIGIPDMDATYTIDVRTMKNHSATANIYFLAGNTPVDNVANYATLSTPAMALTNSTIEHTDSGEINITADMVHDNSVIMVIGNTSGTNIWLNSMTLTPKVTLTEDVNQNITLKDGAVLDLNGYTVTGDVTVVNGQIVDNGDTKGSINGTLVATGNKWLPIKNTDGTYSFYEATAKVGQAIYNEADNSVSFWFDLDMESAAYAKVLSAYTAGAFNIGANLTVGGETYKITNMKDAVEDWLGSNGIYKDENVEDGDGALCVKITNLEILTETTEIILTPVFENLETSVSGMFGDAISYTYEVPAAE